MTSLLIVAGFVILVWQLVGLAALTLQVRREELRARERIAAQREETRRYRMLADKICRQRS